MTVSTTSRRVVGVGNGATTVWPYAFFIPSASQLQVVYTNPNKDAIDPTGAGVVLDPSVYSVTGIGAAGGGNVTYPLAGGGVAAPVTITILRVTPYTQPTTMQALESAIDNLEYQIQQIADVVSRTLQQPISDILNIGPLPPKASRVGNFLTFDANGDPAMTGGTGPDASLRTDLAATGVGKGGLLVGTIRSEAGAVARTVQDKLREFVSVKDFGALGNDVADDRAAIQAAINTGHDVYLPAGTYRISAPLLAPDRRGFVMKGEYQFTFLKATANIAILSFANQTITHGSGLNRIENIFFTAVGAGAATATGVSSPGDYCFSADFSFCTFDGQLRFGVTGNYLMCRFYRCDFGRVPGPGTFKAIRMIGTGTFESFMEIDHCEFHGGNDDYVIDVQFAYLYSIRFCDIEVNTPTTGVVRVTDVNGMYFYHNWLENNGNVPKIKLVDGAAPANFVTVIDGNHIEGQGAGNVQDTVIDTTSSGAKFFTLTNNFIAAVHAICRDNVTDNTIGNCIAFWGNSINATTPGVFALFGIGLTAGSGNKWLAAGGLQMMAGGSVNTFQALTEFHAFSAQFGENKTIIQLTVPATAVRLGIEITAVSSRGDAPNLARGRLAHWYGVISRNGSGSNVVLESTVGAGSFDVPTLSAGGGTDDTKPFMFNLARNGAEANNLPQVVNVRATMETLSTSNGQMRYHCRLIPFDGVVPAYTLI